MKRRKVIVSTSLFFLVTGAIFVTLFLTSEWALQKTYSFFKNKLPGSIELVSLKGRLIGPVKIEELVYKYSEITIKLEQAELDWDIFSLLDGDLHVRALSAKGLYYSAVTSSNGPSKGMVLPNIVLPVSITVDNAHIENISINTDPEEAFLITDIVLSAYTKKQVIYIDRLDVGFPDWQTGITGSLSPNENYNHDLNVSWRLNDIDQYNYQGKGRISGNLEELHIQHELTGTVQAQLDGLVKNPLKQFNWQAEIDIQEVNFTRWMGNTNITSLQAMVEGEGDLNSFSATARLTSQVLDAGSVNGQIMVSHKPGHWQVEKLNLQLAEVKAGLMIKGDIKLADNGHFDFSKDNISHILAEGDWTNWNWPLQGKRIMTSKVGKLALNGKPDDYNLHITGSLDGPDVPASDIELTGNGNTHHLQLEEINAKLLSGRVTGKGEIDFAEGPEWNLTLKGNALDPGIKWPDWNGHISLIASSKGHYKNNHLVTSLNIRGLEGELLSHPVAGEADIRIDGESVSVKTLNLESGADLVNVTGNLSEKWDLGLKTKIRDIGKFIPDSKGSVEMNARITGVRKKPRIKMELASNSFLYGDYSAEGIEANVDVDLADRQKSFFDLNVTNANIKGEPVSSLTLDAKGLFSNHQISAVAAGDFGVVDFIVEGQYKEKIWIGRLTDSSYQQENIEKFQLENGGNILLGSNTLRFTRTCWKQAESRICTEADWHKDRGVNAHASLSEFSLSLLQPFIRQDTQLTGLINGQLDLTYTQGLSGDVGQLLRLDAGINISKGEFKYLLPDEDEIQLSLAGGAIDVMVNPQGARGKMNLDFNDVGNIEAELGLPGWIYGIKPSDQSLEGHLNIVMPDFSILPSIFHQLDQTAGAFTANYQFGGTIRKPLINGRADLANGAIALPQVGINVSNVSLSINSSDTNIINLKGEGESGKGKMGFIGQIEFESAKNIKTNFELSGEDFEIVNLPEVHAFISPSLQLFTANRRVDLVGVLAIPEAVITVKDVSNTVIVSNDVVVVGETDEQEEKWEFYTSVRLELGDKVMFSGFDVAGNITGAVVAVDEPHKTTTGFGEISIKNGKYELFGQKLDTGFGQKLDKAIGQQLDIEVGRLIYVGNPINNPSIDARAIKELENIKVGAQVKGPLLNPHISLFSDPHRDEDEILSYLLLGIPINDASGEGGKSLALAASQLGLNTALRKIGNKFGLEDVRLESKEASDDTLLVIGKYLNPRLYVSYSRGLSSAVDTFRMRYQLGSKWVVQSETGEASGADFFYTYEH